MNPVSVLIVGAGSRGTTYAAYALQHPEQMQVVGVAEPRQWHRSHMAQTYGLAAEHTFSDWQEAAARERFADAVIVATQDAMHIEPAVAFAEKGYAILLEKPLAPNLPDCERIVAAVQRHGVMFAVCHVMRYTGYTRMLKHLLDSGAIGEIVSMQHLEPVGYWHQAHSFVRGNWRNAQESSPMLLQKSCHDLDWIRYIMGQSCTRVASFGSLKHFRASEKPEGAAARCLDCQVEASCPYSAKRIYARYGEGYTGWPLDVLTPNPTPQSIEEALRTGPYGRCVYACDNDVVDHQVVNFEFAGGQTASFTMTAFTQMRERETRIFGTRGELMGDGRHVRIYDFLTEQITTHDSQDKTSATGHSGGDYGLTQAFITAVATGNQNLILSGPEESLESHRMVFAAEWARQHNQVADLNQLRTS